MANMPKNEKMLTVIIDARYIPEHVIRRDIRYLSYLPSNDSDKMLFSFICNANICKVGDVKRSIKIGFTHESKLLCIYPECSLYKYLTFLLTYYSVF